ncbi:MAG: TIGR00282 family metallophosphoesterase [Thermodesulfobacteriota bacterium]|nr:TIGR00282 family metallophosphoesterase [Thermodesulfobacteriota bacterium]
MRILFIGDIVGKPGRRAVSGLLDNIKSSYDIDFVIANAENASGGFGVTRKVVEELLSCGIDILTSGNHIWDKKEIISGFDQERQLLRPANYPTGNPGTGSVIVYTSEGQKVGVLNVLGRVFMNNIDCPFKTAIGEVKKLKAETNVILIDIHAEATSEKMAMGWYLDGMVSAVIGTHTHIQTADERILPEGTAYITDVGMTGAMDSVIGMKKHIIIERFLTQRPQKFEVAKGDIQLNAIVTDIDPKTGRSTGISRLKMNLAH